MTAADLEFGQKATIRNIDLTHPSSQRILEFGFTPGQEIELLNKTLFNDPISISVRGSLIALRKDDAESIQI